MGRLVRSGLTGWVAVSLAACATVGPKHRPATTAAKKAIRLAILPIESDSYPKVATAINEALKTVDVPSVDEVVRSRVSLDVVQLSIECVKPTNACYAAVGKSLNTDLILVAQVSSPPKKAKGVRLLLTMIDVGTAQPVRALDRQFKKQEEAIAGVRQQLSELVNQPAAVADAGR